MIDVGFNRIPTGNGTGRLFGDVATGEAIGRASFITPVPGGVGRMSVVCLLHNSVVVAELRADCSAVAPGAEKRTSPR